jgi:tetratricopeptide (TPR) repeat protein
MMALNFPEGSLAILEESARVAEELSDRPASVRLYSFIGTVYSYTGRTLEALKFTQMAFDEAEKLGDDGIVSQTATRLCVAYFYSGQAVRAADVASRAIALLERTRGVPNGALPEFDQYVSLLAFLGWAKAMLGDPDEGERLCQKGISVAAEVRSQYSLAAAHVFFATVSAYRGKPEDILHHAREAERIGEEAQMPAYIGAGWMLEGLAYYYQGAFAAAKECAEKAISNMLEHRMLAVLSGAYALSGAVSHMLGSLPAAKRSLEQALKVAQENNQKHYEGQARIFLGRLIIDEDTSQIAVAERTILDGLKMLEDLQIKPLQAMGHLNLGESYAIAGQTEKALASLKKAQQMCQEMGMDYYLDRTEKALEKLEGS